MQSGGQPLAFFLGLHISAINIKIISQVGLPHYSSFGPSASQSVSTHFPSLHSGGGETEGRLLAGWGRHGGGRRLARGLPLSVSMRPSGQSVWRGRSLGANAAL